MKTICSDDIVPSRLIDRADQGTEGTLLCPECRCTYSHIARVFTRLGSDSNEATIYPGTIQGGTTACRRSSLVIEIDGECEHSWRLVIQQQKGNNYVSVEYWQRPEGKED